MLPIRTELGSTDERLGRIVRILADNPMVVISGTKLGEELGTSRSEVWRLVQQLRSLGVDIAGHPAEGYRMESVPDLLLPDIIGPLLKGTIFDRAIHHFFKLPSTNVTAMQLAAEGEPEGAVFFAEEQTAGRGRGGHTWHSARSTGIYMSVILRPSMLPTDALLLSLATGLATASAIQQVTGFQPDLRWPNDLLIHDSAGRLKKFCGILVEMNAEPTRVRHVVAGIGINVNQDYFPPDLEPIATSLRIATGRSWSRVAIAAALLQSLDREYSALADKQSILRRFEQGSSYSTGRRVHCPEDGGYTGTSAGLDDRGFLRIRLDDGTVKTVLSGGVRAIDDPDAEL